jgi:hypothetical protein
MAGEEKVPPGHTRRARARGNYNIEPVRSKAEARARADKKISAIDNSCNPVPPRTKDTYPAFQKQFIYLRELWGCHAVSKFRKMTGRGFSWFHNDFRPWSTRSDK